MVQGPRVAPIRGPFVDPSPILVLLFIGSGCSALIYEIVWFQLLEFVIGSSAISLGILLGTFMGGMCIGSLLIPRLVSVERHPLRVYALLEFGIGIIGILVLWIVPHAGGIYGAIYLLPPTALMGATLPIIARWVEMTPQVVSRLGFFYGSNIAGAILGSILAGFYLLRVYDMATATYVAAAINVAIAAIGLQVARTCSYDPAVAESVPLSPNARAARSTYVVIALSGLCALGAQVVWTRLLSLLVGASVYTFSIILAVFLLGLALGSVCGAVRSRGTSRPWRDLAICQFLLTGAIAWAAFMLARSVPYWPIDPALSGNVWFNFQLDLLRCMWVVLPSALLWGASFPLALGSLGSLSRDSGNVVGRLYAANTLGAIIGALGFSLVMVQWFGTQHAQQFLIVVSAVAGALMLVNATRITLMTATASLLGALLTTALVLSVPAVNAEMIAYGRFLPLRLAFRDPQTRAPFDPHIIYVGEGLNSSIAVSEPSTGGRYFHVSGKIEASNVTHDMRLQRMLGHLPALFHPHPRSVLVVGFGTGVTASTFILYPSVERVVVCELESLIPKTVSQYFRTENYNLLQDPRVEVVYDDARHYLVTAKEKFDIISSDPIHPWVKGSASLYTQEYFELVKQHLNPGGIVSQWVPLYESGERTVKSQIATFFDVFPNGTIWSNNVEGAGTDLVLLATDGPTRINFDELNKRLNRADHRVPLQSMKAVRLNSPIDLLATYVGRKAGLASWLATAEINQDRNLRLQYLAGMELNQDEAWHIYSDIVSYRTFPDDIFTGSDESKKELKNALAQKTQRP